MFHCGNVWAFYDSHPCPDPSAILLSDTDSGTGLPIICSSQPHLQETEVSVVLHHGDLQVAHHYVAAGVHVLYQVVLDL